MEQHPVPQNITTFQFRLIGDMTIKQFGYLAGGIILAYISYKLPLPFFFTWPMAIVCAFTGFGFAFVPIEERPMDIWVFAFLKNVYNPTVFHWEHTEGPPEPPKNKVPPPVKAPLLTIPQILPSPHAQTTPAVRVAATTNKPAPAPQPPTPVAPPSFVHPPADYGRAQQPTTQNSVLETRHSELGTRNSELKTPSPIDSFFSFIDSLFVAKPKAPPAYVVQQRPNLTMRPAVQNQPQQYKQTPSLATPSITGSGIKVVQTEDGKRRTEDRAQKTESGGTADVKAMAGKQNTEEKKTEENLTHLKTELETVQKELSQKTMEEKRFTELQQQLAALMAERQSMENELVALRTRVQSQPLPTPQAARPAGVVPNAPTEPTVKTMSVDVATRAGLPRLTTYPNVVTGIIKDYDNNLLPGVLVTVKDKEGVPLRALKTNKLGQFAASTQLANGTYVVEVEDPRERFMFDRVQITINGAVMPALQIVAKNKRTLDREKLAKEIFGSPNAST